MRLSFLKLWLLSNVRNSVNDHFKERLEKKTSSLSRTAQPTQLQNPDFEENPLEKESPAVGFFQGDLSSVLDLRGGGGGGGESLFRGK